MKSTTLQTTPSTDNGSVRCGGISNRNSEGVNLTDMETLIAPTQVKIEQSETYKVAYTKQSLINILDMFDEMSPERTKNWLQSVLNKL
jgi:hypothetical protein